MNIREERTGDSGGLAAPLAATHQAQGRHRGGRRPRGNNSGNAEASSGECKADQMGENPKAPVKVPTPEDFKRYEGYAGQKWTGVCKWFNVSKGFGFVLPDHEQAKEHEDDVFLHQSALQMPGFRSLGEGEAIQFTVKIGKRGLEADEVTGIDGADIQGHTIRPVGRKKDTKIRASKCREPAGSSTQKVCYHCQSADHLLSECPTYVRSTAAAKNSGVKPTEDNLKSASVKADTDNLPLSKLSISKETQAQK